MHGGSPILLPGLDHVAAIFVVVFVKLLRRANRNLREKAALVPDASASIWTEHHLVCRNLRSGLKQISSTRNMCCLPRLKTRLRDLLLRRLSSSALAMDLDPGPG